MLVTLASQSMSNLRIIPDVYAKIPALNSKETAHYAKTPDFYAGLSL